MRNILYVAHRLSARLVVYRWVMAAGAISAKRPPKQAYQLGRYCMFGRFLSAITLFHHQWRLPEPVRRPISIRPVAVSRAFQNGLAMPGLHVGGLLSRHFRVVFGSGFDGLIFSIGWLVGAGTHFLDGERVAQSRQVYLPDARPTVLRRHRRVFSRPASLVVVPST